MLWFLQPIFCSVGHFHVVPVGMDTFKGSGAIYIEHRMAGWAKSNNDSFCYQLLHFYGIKLT